MEAPSLIAVVAAAAFLAFGASLAAGDGARIAHRWIVPAAGSVGFLLFSLYTIAAEGPAGFWTEHTRNFWGNQIWMDLLLAASVALYFLVPQAKKLGMRPAPWIALVACSGGIGLLAMTARVLYLHDRAALPASATTARAA